MSENRKMLVTTALFYSNGPLHLGHMVEAIQADIWVRFQRMRGHECLFFSGDDTHGTPILVKARQNNQTPEELISNNYELHTSDFRDFLISYDNYSSTNTDINKALTEDFFEKMNSGGHIHVESIEQSYCNHDKMFLPDRFVKGTCPKCGASDQYGDSCDVCGSTYATTDVIEPQCTICGNTPTTKPSDHLFFRLNHFKEFLTKWVPNHTAKEVSNKLQEWLSEDLRDWDISRDEPYFGFQIPGYPGKYFYVWVDAPIGYVASSQEWAKNNGKNVDEYWSPETKNELYHFIGKDITYFHTLFWPAMLKTAGYKTPNSVFIHGFLTINGEKMSKSKGTFITARHYLDHFSPQYLRYYLACKTSPALDDMDLNLEDFAQRINSDLVGKLANLGSRSAQMLHKHFEGKLGRLRSDSKDVVKKFQKASDEIATHFEERQFSKAMVAIRDLADEANIRFDQASPWKSVKEKKQQAHEDLTEALHLFRLLSIYITPVLPQFSEKVATLFQEAPYTLWNRQEELFEEKTLAPFEHLIQRIDTKKIEQLVSPTESVAKETPPKKSKKGLTVSEDGLIDIKDFQKVKLQVVQVKNCEEVDGSDKLLKLEVQVSETETRTIFSGIKSSYQATDLVGRQLLAVTNLKPRKMRFGLSEGMILCASKGEHLFLVSPDEGAAVGSEVN